MCHRARGEANHGAFQQDRGKRFAARQSISAAVTVSGQQQDHGLIFRNLNAALRPMDDRKHPLDADPIALRRGDQSAVWDALRFFERSGPPVQFIVVSTVVEPSDSAIWAASVSLGSTSSGIVSMRTALPSTSPAHIEAIDFQSVGGLKGNRSVRRAQIA